MFIHYILFTVKFRFNLHLQYIVYSEIIPEFLNFEESLNQEHVKGL